MIAFESQLTLFAPLHTAGAFPSIELSPSNIISFTLSPIQDLSLNNTHPLSKSTIPSQNSLSSLSAFLYSTASSRTIVSTFGDLLFVTVHFTASLLV